MYTHTYIYEYIPISTHSTKAGSTISWLGAKVKGALAVPTAATSATPTSNQSATTAATAALFTSSGGGCAAVQLFVGVRMQATRPVAWAVSTAPLLCVTF